MLGGMFLGKESHLLRGPFILAEEFDGLAPGSLLAAVEFAQIKHMPLDHLTRADTPAFDDAPVKVFFAILEPFGATQEHDGPRR